MKMEKGVDVCVCVCVCLCVTALCHVHMRSLGMRANAEFLARAHIHTRRGKDRKRQVYIDDPAWLGGLKWGLRKQGLDPKGFITCVV